MQNSDIKRSIQEIAYKIDQIERELERHKKQLTKNAFDGIDAKVFIKGKYIAFDEQKQSLEILVDGSTRYYPLSDYYSKRLPFPDSTVAIFSEEKSNGKIAKIFAIYRGEIDRLTLHKSFVFKGVKNRRAIFYAQTTGYIAFDMPENLIEKYGIKLDQSVDFREIIYGIKHYFVPQIELGSIRQDRLKILELLKENA